MQAQKHRPLVVLVLLRSEGSMENAEVIRDRIKECSPSSHNENQAISWSRLDSEKEAFTKVLQLLLIFS